METNNRRAILPDKGIWTVGDLADWLEVSPTQCLQKLSDAGVKVLSLGKHYNNKIIRLEDLKAGQSGKE
jgi:hypothetical protein